MPKGYRMTIEELRSITSEYEELGKFRTERNSTYQLISRKGLLQELCGHMKRTVRKSMSDDELAEIALRYNDLLEFQQKDQKIFLKQS